MPKPSFLVAREEPFRRAPSHGRPVGPKGGWPVPVILPSVEGCD